MTRRPFKVKIPTNVSFKSKLSKYYRRIYLFFSSVPDTPTSLSKAPPRNVNESTPVPEFVTVAASVEVDRKPHENPPIEIPTPDAATVAIAPAPAATTSVTIEKKPIVVRRIVIY